MALNIKDRETEQLAAEVAALTGESKTGAVRRALKERKERLLLERGGRGRGDRFAEALDRIWELVPEELRGKPVTKEEVEELLGYGPDGV